MKLTFTVTKIGSEDEPDKFVAKMAPSEVSWHIALKILGYLLFFDRKPQIEQDVGQHYRPDLFVWDEFKQNVSLWIDCGNIAVKKIDKIATKMGKTGEFYILRRTKRDADRLRDQIKNIKYPARVTIIAFEDGFVDKIADLLESTNRIEFKLDGAYQDDDSDTVTLLVGINNHVGTSRLHIVSGAFTCKS